MSITIKHLGRSFSPPELKAMYRTDPKSTQGRYDDINGPSVAQVLPKVGWSYAEIPFAIALLNDEAPVAIGFAAPIFLRQNNSSHMNEYDGINLSYTVHSEHEGRGFGLIASCLVLVEADKRWGQQVKKGFLNIQTRAANVRSNALARVLGAHPSEDASFEVTLDSGVHIAYAGFRTPWPVAIQQAKDHLNRVLSEVFEPAQALVQELEQPAG